MQFIDFYFSPIKDNDQNKSVTISQQQQTNLPITTTTKIYTNTNANIELNKFVMSIINAYDENGKFFKLKVQITNIIELNLSFFFNSRSTFEYNRVEKNAYKSDYNEKSGENLQ